MDSIIYIAVVIAIIAIVVLKMGKRQNVPRKTVTFLIGDPNSGKTSLLFDSYQLVNRNHNFKTVNSMEPNEASIEREGRTYRVVDVPGHSYAKEQFLARIPEARNVVFMVDATSVQSIHGVSEFLYNILIQTTFIANKPPLLFVLNKQDNPQAFKTADFELFLSREVEKLKKSRRALQEIRDGINDQIKYNEQAFSLDNYSNIKVVEASVKQEKIEEIEKFIF